MKFNSVKEYFIKLSSNGYQRMMIPLVIFIFYFGQSSFGLLKPFLSDAIFVDVIFITCTIATIISLTTVQISFQKKNKSIATFVGLGLKLDKYGDEAVLKMKWIGMIAIIAPVALFITGDLRLTVLFGIVFLWFFIQWPSPRKVARQLKLKGDERTMVITKGDAFKFF